MTSLTRLIPSTPSRPSVDISPMPAPPLPRDAGERTSTKTVFSQGTPVTVPIPSAPQVAEPVVCVVCGGQRTKPTAAGGETRPCTVCDGVGHIGGAP